EIDDQHLMFGSILPFTKDNIFVLHIWPNINQPGSSAGVCQPVQATSIPCHASSLCVCVVDVYLMDPSKNIC
ncbi:hypothetical protein ACJX0J_012490, partial [Zea mays]